MITSNTNCNGFVVYSDAEKPIALGIVSSDHKRKAITTHVPQNLKSILINIEDVRFYTHKGIDYKSIVRALVNNYKAKKIIQGGSTITQQLARNLGGNNRRTISRKVIEAFNALKIERHHSKEDILNLYFENIYFGRNIYGLRAASLHYFGKEPFKLTYSEQLVLLTILRGPNFYINQKEFADRRFGMLNDILHSRKIISHKKHVINKNFNIHLQNNFLQIFNNESISFLSKNINQEKKTITSTLDYKLQTLTNDWVKNSKYPVSIVCISRGKVIALSSTFGDKYIFKFRTNVGSTLKPFIYTFLRDKGISAHKQYSTLSVNNIGWDVREVAYTGQPLTIMDALFTSNNNAFVNACFEVGIDELYFFLSDFLKKKTSEFSPASILGATQSGITLYELANYYYNFFFSTKQSENKKECYRILNQIAKDRLAIDIDNVFLKTGTTNENKERFAVFGNEDKVFAVLRGENPINDNSKEGSFIRSIGNLAKNIFKNKEKYKWSS